MILFWPNYKAEGGPSFINGASRSRINDQLSLDFEGYIVGWKFEHIIPGIKLKLQEYIPKSTLLSPYLPQILGSINLPQASQNSSCLTEHLDLRLFGRALLPMSKHGSLGTVIMYNRKSKLKLPSKLESIPLAENFKYHFKFNESCYLSIISAMNEALRLERYLSSSSPLSSLLTSAPRIESPGCYSPLSFSSSLFKLHTLVAESNFFAFDKWTNSLKYLFMLDQLKKKNDDIKNVLTTSPRDYNVVLRLISDSIIGIVIGYIITENADTCRLQFQKFQAFSVSFVVEMVDWLMGWPAGMKLNANLDKFLGEVFLWLVTIWSSVIRGSSPILEVLFFSLNFFVASLGASILIGFAIDLLTLSTFHLFLFYLISSKLYHSSLTLLSSLFRLFRGMRANVLRKRLDKCDYDLDQLLLGTILFTLLSFLFPTVAVFYFFIVNLHLAFLFLVALLELSLKVLQEFPYYLLLLRIIYPQRLSDGLAIIKANGLETNSDNKAVYIYLEACPVPYYKLIFDFWSSSILPLIKFYASFSTLFNVLKGNLILSYSKRK